MPRQDQTDLLLDRDFLQAVQTHDPDRSGTVGWSLRPHPQLRGRPMPKIRTMVLT
jgi:hypothetical protein